MCCVEDFDFIVPLDRERFEAVGVVYVPSNAASECELETVLRLFPRLFSRKTNLCEL